MGEAIRLDYYYGTEKQQASFLRIPQLLITDSRFCSLSNDAKLLYGLMLSRISLSVKNGWKDAHNRVYIYYALDEIMKELRCARATCVKILAELDNKKGVGLIERKRQGQGRPDIIYVKNIILESETQVESAGEKPDIQKFKNYTSESSESETMEVQNLNPNYIEYKQINSSYTQSIYPSDNNSDLEPEEYREQVRQNIEYDIWMQSKSDDEKDLVEEIYQIICDVVCVRQEKIRIGSQYYPYEVVKSRFLKLNTFHVQYVIECMKNTYTRINNIFAYLRTVLYNAPITMKHYYQQAVLCDMYRQRYSVA